MPSRFPIIIRRKLDGADENTYELLRTGFSGDQEVGDDLEAWTSLSAYDVTFFARAPGTYQIKFEFVEWVDDLETTLASGTVLSTGVFEVTVET